MPSRKLTISVINDYACPWCFIGKRNLESALARLATSLAEGKSVGGVRGSVDTILNWRHYVLRPNQAGTTVWDHLVQTCTLDDTTAEPAWKKLVDAADAAGIALHNDSLLLDTTAAHCLVEQATEQDRQERTERQEFRTVQLDPKTEVTQIITRLCLTIGGVDCSDLMAPAYHPVVWTIDDVDYSSIAVKAGLDRAIRSTILDRIQRQREEDAGKTYQTRAMIARAERERNVDTVDVAFVGWLWQKAVVCVTTTLKQLPECLVGLGGSLAAEVAKVPGIQAVTTGPITVGEPVFKPGGVADHVVEELFRASLEMGSTFNISDPSILGRLADQSGVRGAREWLNVYKTGLQRQTKGRILFDRLRGRVAQDIEEWTSKQRISAVPMFLISSSGQRGDERRLVVLNGGQSPEVFWEAFQLALSAPLV